MKKHRNDIEGQIITLYDHMPIRLSREEINLFISDLEKVQLRLRGKVAFDSIYQKVKKLTISKDTNKKDAIDHILKSFDLPADYKNFELEIILNDGTKLEYVD